MLMAMAISLSALAMSADAADAHRPGPVHGLEIVALEDRIVISGYLPEDHSSYGIKGVHIYRGTGPETLSLRYTLKAYAETTGYFVYRDVEVANGVTYYYRVAAFNVLGDGELSELLAATSIGAPPAPQDLSASVTCGYVRLTWSPPPSDGGSPITHYSVFRGLRGSEPTLIANVSALSYDDRNVTFGDSFYSYETCAVNENGPGKHSRTVFASMPMPVVNGRIIDARGEPIAGAMVTVDSNGTTASTGPNGTFSIALTPGPHRLTVWIDGRSAHWIDLVAPSGAYDLGDILVNDKGRGPGLGLDTIAFMGVIAIVTTGMVIWAMGKARIR
jgi:titin